ncbi:hypothetical protein D3C81_1729050 [compost metagenome]
MHPAVLTHDLGVTERTVAEQPGQAQQHDQHQRVPSHPFETPDPLLHSHVFFDGVVP